MKKLGQAAIGLLALIGIGAAGYRTYKLRQIEKERDEAEKDVEAATDDSRG